MPAWAALCSLLASLVAAGIIGLVQWLALRWLLAPMRTGSQGIAWVILTMFGYTAGFLVAGLVTGLFGENLTPGDAAKITFLAWGLVGLFTGGLQWMGCSSLRAARPGGWGRMASAMPWAER